MELSFLGAKVHGNESSIIWLGLVLGSVLELVYRSVSTVLPSSMTGFWQLVEMAALRMVTRIITVEILISELSV